MAQPEATVLWINSSLLTATSNATIDAKEQSLVIVLGSKRVSGLVSSAVRRVSILYWLSPTTSGNRHIDGTMRVVWLQRKRLEDLSTRVRQSRCWEMRPDYLVKLASDFNRPSPGISGDDYLCTILTLIVVRRDVLVQGGMSRVWPQLFLFSSNYTGMQYALGWTTETSLSRGRCCRSAAEDLKYTREWHLV